MALSAVRISSRSSAIKILAKKPRNNSSSGGRLNGAPRDGNTGNAASRGTPREGIHSKVRLAKNPQIFAILMTVLGVHALGQRATEIIHIGQAVLFYRGSVEYFRDMVFNYRAVAEIYKIAALDGLNKP